MSNLYHFEMLFLICLDDLKDVDKKNIKKLNKRLNAFSGKAKNILDTYAVPLSLEVPISFTLMTGCSEQILNFSNILFKDENLQMKCKDSNMFPILLSNQLMVNSYKSFPINIEKRIDKIKYKIQKYAIKYNLDGEFYTQLYETKEEIKKLVKINIPIDIKAIQNYQGLLR